MKCPHCDVRVDEHETSRCLDAWVAEDVMGWTKKKIKGSDGVTRTYWKSETKPYKELWQFSPSANIADTWEVVEKLNSSGHVVEIINDCVAWSVRFINIDTDKKYISDWKCSLETQICHAAIKAVHNAR